MFCSYCGTKLPEKSLFCPSCGSRQSQQEAPTKPEQAAALESSTHVTTNPTNKSNPRRLRNVFVLLLVSVIACGGGYYLGAVVNSPYHLPAGSPATWADSQWVDAMSSLGACNQVSKWGPPNCLFEKEVGNIGSCQWRVTPKQEFGLSSGREAGKTPGQIDFWGDGWGMSVSLVVDSDKSLSVFKAINSQLGGQMAIGPANTSSGYADCVIAENTQGHD
jgi:hypothetical protein